MVGFFKEKRGEFLHLYIAICLPKYCYLRIDYITNCFNLIISILFHHRLLLLFSLKVQFIVPEKDNERNVFSNLLELLHNFGYNFLNLYTTMLYFFILC